MSSDRPIFVIGCARSGTTMLQLMIHSHGRLSMPPENRFVLPVYERRCEFGDLRDAGNVDRLADYILEREASRFGDFDLDADEVRRRFHAAPSTLGSLMATVFEAYAEANGKPRWGDKRPLYVQHMDRIIELFPDAQIVHIVRDGRDSVSSLMGMRWYTAGFCAAVHKWRSAIDVGTELSESLPAEQYFQFRYEDLVAQPKTELRRLCEFLDEPFDHAMLEYHRISSVPDWKKSHPNTSKPVNSDALQRWRTDLSRAQVQLFEWVAGEQLQAQGYQLSRARPFRLRPPRQLRSEWAEFLEGHAEAVLNRQRAESARREEYSHPVAAVVTSRQRELARQQGWLDERTQVATDSSISPPDSATS